MGAECRILHVPVHIPYFSGRAGAALLAPPYALDLGRRTIGWHDLACELVRSYSYVVQYVVGDIGNRSVGPNSPS